MLKKLSCLILCFLFAATSGLILPVSAQQNSANADAPWLSGNQLTSWWSGEDYSSEQSYAWQLSVGYNWVTRTESQHNESKYFLDINLNEQTTLFVSGYSDFESTLYLKVDNSENGYSQINIGKIPAGNYNCAFNISENTHLLSYSGENLSVMIKGIVLEYNTTAGKKLRIDSFGFGSGTCFNIHEPNAKSVNWFNDSEDNNCWWNWDWKHGTDGGRFFITHPAVEKGFTVSADSEGWHYTLNQTGSRAGRAVCYGETMNININTTPYFYLSYQSPATFELKLRANQSAGHAESVKIADLAVGNSNVYIDLRSKPAIIELADENGNISFSGMEFSTLGFVKGDKLTISSACFQSKRREEVTPIWFTPACDKTWYSEHCYSGITNSDGGFYINYGTGAKWQYFHRWSINNKGSAPITVSGIEYTLNTEANNAVSYDITVSKAVSLYLNLYSPVRKKEISVFLTTLNPGANAGKVSLIDNREIANCISQDGLLLVKGLSFYTWSFVYGNVIDVNSFAFGYSQPSGNKPAILGDINKNGKRDDNDVSALKLAVIKNDTVEQQNDYNSDGKADISDVVLLKMAMCGMANPASVNLPENTHQALYETYYVDSANGNDINDGKTQQTPWKSLTKVNSAVVAPGTKILFKCGGVWNGRLAPKSSGNAQKKIIIGSYGTGNRPIINGNGDSYAVLLRNLQYIEVCDLEITNTGTGSQSRMGVYVNAGGSGNPGGYYQDITLKNLKIHDVSGKEGDRWNGGIVFVSNISKTPTAFSNVLVENCSISDISGNGITITSDYNNRQGVTWGVGDYFPSESIIFRGNYIANASGDGIFFNCVKGGVIEYNTVTGCCFANGAYAGLWPHNSSNIVMQYNEAYDTKLVGGDGQGYDVDINCNNTTVQYNYSHDNEGGFILLCTDGVEQGWNDGVVVRYNVSQNDKSRIFTLSGPISNVNIYNNTIYTNDTLKTNLVGAYDWGDGKSPADARFFNNIFYMNSEGWDNSFAVPSRITFENNIFYGSYDFTSVQSAKCIDNIMGNPGLKNPGNSGLGISDVGGYRLKSDSICINKGILFGNNGIKDYDEGWILRDGQPDMGAFEYFE